MLFVGLTGGLGAGKSTALEAFSRCGAETISSDAVVHDLLGSADVREALESRWGERVLAGDRLDRERVAEIVFADARELEWLERLLHPLVGERLQSWRHDLERGRPDPPKIAVVEVPLLFETGMEGAFDVTVAVVADDSVREGRAAARGHVARTERESRQMSQAEKAARADFCMQNNGTESDLERMVCRLVEQLVSGA